MNANINVIYSSDLCKIIDFKCKCDCCAVSKKEYSKSFNISFIRKGNFGYKGFRYNFDAYNGYAIVDKPDSEHVVEHRQHSPDECTIIDFTDNFYQILREKHKMKYKLFFENEDIQSLLFKTDNKVEYLHYLLISQFNAKYFDTNYTESLVMEILHWFLDRMDNRMPQSILATKLKRQHLHTIEKAKDFIFNNFIENITINDIACYCNVSPFHFSRIFKEISSYTPYQFLLNTRLTNAKQLIVNSGLPINEVGFLSGFQSAENFDAAFKNKFHYSPSYLRKSKNP